MLINQGAIYWLDLSTDAAPRIPHPHLVIQADSLNHDSAISTVELCAITTNAKKLSIAGNILLEAGEANLAKQSIVEVSKTVSIDKRQLGDYIGTVSAQRLAQILAGRRFVEISFLGDRE